MESLVLAPLLRVVFEKLASPVLSKLQSHSEFNKEIKKLQDRWLTVQAVIEDAEERQLKDPKVKLWLKRLKDVAYDADDLLDLITARALQRQMRNNKKKVLNFSLHPLFDRLKMSRELRDIRERLDEIARDMSDFQLRDVFIHRRIDTGDRLETGPYVNESEVFGREEDVETIIEMLLSSSSSKSNHSRTQTVSVISIVGMGGIGKTTLAQLAYNDERVMNHFDLRIWVSVNNTFSFNVRKVITNILDYAARTKCESSQLGVLQSSLQESLRGKRYLLVLDDVWNQNLHEWEKLRNPLTRRGTDGSKIIVTTRSNVVADIMSTTLPHTLQALTDEDCWNLFKQQSFSEGEETTYPNLASIGRQIVNKCRGVPLAAKVLGTLMRFKRDESEWLYVQESELSDLCDRSILPILRLSYNHLPPYLKRCFEYCAVFPKGYEINKERLIHQWIAEGLIQSPGDGISSKKMEDTGNDYFKDLLSMSFFQVVRECDDGEITEFKMHDLIHDLAKHITRNEILILRHNHPPLLSWANHAQIRHVSVEGNLNSLLLLGASLGAKKLRSLNLLSPGDDSGKALPTLIPHLEHLRVLNLSGCAIKLLHKSIGDSMLLRCLDLSNTTLQRLPEAVCRLCNLQTLNLSGCKDLVELPSGTSNLINLRHLNIKDCGRLSHMPDNLGKLRNLQTLPIFIIGHMLEKSLFQLVHMELRGELQIKRLQNVGKIVTDLCLVNKQLHSLSLSWENDNGGNLNHHSSGQIAEEYSSNVENVLRCLQPNSNLRRLSLKEYSGMMFPQWMNHATLPNLTKLDLINCRGCKNLPTLGQLQFLKVLTMQGMDSVAKIGSDFYGKESRRQPFPSLTELTLRDFPELGTWESMDSTEAFLCLNRLTIIKCPKLKNMLCFPSLLHLELCDCNATILGSAAELSSLTSLVIDIFPELLSIPKALFQNNSLLTSLTVSSCPQLSLLPPSFGVLAALKSLTIRGCHELGTSPHELLQLTCLENLEIVECPRLDSSPEESFKGLKSLRSLYIENCNRTLRFVTI